MAVRSAEDNASVSFAMTVIYTINCSVNIPEAWAGNAAVRADKDGVVSLDLWPWVGYDGILLGGSLRNQQHWCVACPRCEIRIHVASLLRQIGKLLLNVALQSLLFMIVTVSESVNHKRQNDVVILANFACPAYQESALNIAFARCFNVTWKYMQQHSSITIF